MTTIKTDDLTPAQINMLVAVAEGFEARTFANGGTNWIESLPTMRYHQSAAPDFCGDWAKAGPIMERERITLMARGGHGWQSSVGDYIPMLDNDPPHGTGPTALVAAMRAYVLKRYGDVILTTDKPWLLEAAAS